MGACCSSPSAEHKDEVASMKMRKKEQKRLLLEAVAAEVKMNEILSRIPGRICSNGALSNEACVFTQQGRKGTNQDAMVVWEGFAMRKDTVFCGVFDGHGPYGHLVARRVRDSLPSKLASIWKSRIRGDPSSAGEIHSNPDSGKGNMAWADQQQTPIMELIDDDEEGGEEEEKEMEEEESKTFVNWRDSFLEAFDSMDWDLRTHPAIDSFCSGSTAVTVLKQGDDLVIGNVGDSRAILARRTDEDEMEAIQLTVDLKPNLPREAERILKCKGRVFALEDEPEVARVWLPYDDAPGLAMARAFGDFCLKDYGLIAVPDVTHRKVVPEDEFIVLATDGIWDVLSNQEVVDVVASAPTRTTAARALVETAVRAWRLKYPNSKIDDCAVVCLYLRPMRPKANGKAPRSRKGRHIHLDQIPVPNPEEEDDDDDDDDEEEEEEEEEDHHHHHAHDGIHGNGEDPSPQLLPHHHLRTNLGAADRPHSKRSVAEVLSLTAEEEEEWSALDGVVRVNSLLQLPRFLKGQKRGRSVDV